MTRGGATTVRWVVVVATAVVVTQPAADVPARRPAAPVMQPTVDASTGRMTGVGSPETADSEPRDRVHGGEPVSRATAHAASAPVAAGGRTLAVPRGGDLQAALDSARPGDTIALDPGAVYTGPFTLPAKSGDDWVVVRTRSFDEAAGSGRRVGPRDAARMATLQAATRSVIVTAAGAHHYRFVGLELRPAPGKALVNVVELGSDRQTADAVPHHLTFDRVYVHGDPERGARRGIALNSASTTVVDSYFADFKQRGVEAQAIAGWNGPGPFTIAGNYLEASGENVMFGGADPSIPGLVPSDIEIRRNHLTKPLAWNRRDRAASGAAWTVKNLFELKNARRVLVDGNVFEHNWVDAQAGAAILFTVRNQDGRAPWSTVADVRFTNNIVRHSAAGLQILGRDNNHPSGRTERVLVRNVLFDDIGGERWGGNGRLFELYDGSVDVVIDHVTAFHTGNVITAHGAPHRGFVFRNTIAPHNQYGVFGTNAGVGAPTLETYFPGAVFTRNVLPGGPSSSYPPGNFFPATVDTVGFVARGTGDYRLGSASRHRNQATDGGDPGIDVSALNAAISGVVQPAAIAGDGAARR